MNAIILTTDTFDQHLADTSLPTLVEFWAIGCGPCAALMPHLDDLARTHADQLKVATVKLDDAPDLALRYEIMALPTLILFTAGQPAKRITTVTTKRDVLAEIEALLDTSD